MLYYGLHQVRIERLDTDCRTGDTQKNDWIQIFPPNILTVLMYVSLILQLRLNLKLRVGIDR